jgi:hypothetical protein
MRPFLYLFCLLGKPVNREANFYGLVALIGGMSSSWDPIGKHPYVNRSLSSIHRELFSSIALW